jgi:hypothetical protein
MKISTIKQIFSRIVSITSLLLIATTFTWQSCSDDIDSEQAPVLPEAVVDSLSELLESVDRIYDTLTGNWVNAKFLAEIQKTSSPFYSQNRILPIAEVILDEEKGSMQLIFGYNEACKGFFERKGDALRLLSCDDNPELTFTFEYDPFKKELLLQADEVNLRFVRQSFKVEEAGLGIQRALIREKLNGNWQSARAQRPFGGKLSFDERGFVKGLSSYNKFKFILGYDSYPAFMDVIWLYRGAREHDAWYWQLEEDSLRFYSFPDNAPDLFEEKAVYYRLP